MNFKIGHAKDVHQLVIGRKLILGGIEIEHDKGLLGHSDADVLIHAIGESLIGAMGLGDIGTFYPDTDSKFKDIDSQILLKDICHILQKNKYQIGNIDATVFAEKPKINPFINQIRANLAKILNISIKNINVKATRGEKMGFIGREEGMGAESVCLIYKGE